MGGAGRLLTKTEIVTFLTVMGEILAAQKRVGTIYVVGGAAIALGYDSTRRTEDVDSAILRETKPVQAAAREVAKRFGVDEEWFNDAALGFMPEHDDKKAQTVFSHPGLRVIIGAPEELLAMKILAARPKDFQDINLLLRVTNHPSVEEALRLIRLYFPKAVLREESLDLLKNLYGIHVRLKPGKYARDWLPHLEQQDNR